MAKRLDTKDRVWSNKEMPAGRAMSESMVDLASLMPREIDETDGGLRRLRLRNERMKGGKASAASRILTECYQHLFRAYKQSGRDLNRHPRVLVIDAIQAGMPSVETTTVKVGGASYQVPMPMDPRRSQYFGVKWLVDSAKARMKKDRLHGMAEALALEVMAVNYDMHGSQTSTQGSADTDGLKGKKKGRDYQSNVLVMKSAMHRTAKTNRVFSHRRWR